MFLTVACAFAVMAAYHAPDDVIGPLTEPVCITDVDLAAGRFSYLRTLYVHVSVDAWVERDGRLVKVRTSTEDVRQVKESNTIRHWRLANKQGQEFEWAKAKGKTVVLHRTNRLPDKQILALYGKNSLFLYGRD